MIVMMPRTPKNRPTWYILASMGFMLSQWSKKLHSDFWNTFWLYDSQAKLITSGVCLFYYFYYPNYRLAQKGHFHIHDWFQFLYNLFPLKKGGQDNQVPSLPTFSIQFNHQPCSQQYHPTTPHPPPQKKQNKKNAHLNLLRLQIVKLGKVKLLAFSIVVFVSVGYDIKRMNLSTIIQHATQNIPNTVTAHNNLKVD